MPQRVRVEVREARERAPSVASLAAVALAALVVGVIVARASLEDGTLASEAEAGTGSEMEAVTGSETEAAADTDTGTGTDTDSGTDTDTTTDATSEAEVETVADAGTGTVTATPDTATPATPGSAPALAAALAAANRRVVPGRVAYLRCEGAPPSNGPYPCPRDLELERAAWAVLETLPACAMAPVETGEADVRVAFVASSPTEVRLRPSSGAEGEVDGARLLACLREPLSALTTTIPSHDLVVSFRFELVAR